MEFSFKTQYPRSFKAFNFHVLLFFLVFVMEVGIHVLRNACDVFMNWNCPRCPRLLLFC